MDNSIQDKRMQEGKLILWLIYDIFTVGMGSVSLLNSFLIQVNDAEKIIVFLLFVTMAGYRIRILHHASKRKRLENKEYELEIEERKRKLKIKK